MRVHTITEERNAARALQPETGCPFYTDTEQTCRAATGIHGKTIPAGDLCMSDDYDRCPRFLAHLLRRSQPNRVDHDWLDAI